MSTASSNSLHRKSGQLKITLWEVSDFTYDRPIKVAARLTDGDAEFEQDGRSPQALIPKDGKANFNVAFKFGYQGEREVELTVHDASDNDREISGAQWPLAEVLRRGIDENWVKLNPKGKMRVELTWMAAPERTPEKITISDLFWSPIDSTGTHGERFFCVVVLGDEELGRTQPIQIRDGTFAWPESFTKVYQTEADLCVMVFEEGEDEEPYGTSDQDLWGFFRKSDKPCVKGITQVLTPGPGGKLGIRINFWDTPEEQVREARDFEEEGSQPESAQPTRALVPRGMSQDSEPSNNFDEVQRAIDDARRAAEAAAADGARAREVADLLKQTPLVGGAAADAVRGADKAARAATDDAARAQAIVADLESRRPLSTADLDMAIRDVTDLAKKARSNRDTATDRGRDAAAVSAREDARAARESHRAAERSAGDTKVIADGYPHIRQFHPIVTEATGAASNAGEDAREAHNRAEDAEDADSLHDALEACRAAHEAALRAKREEETADDAYKRALALAKRADRAAEKRLRKKQQEEEEALRLAREQKEMLRKMDHDADMARRRENLLMAGDANEQGVYTGTMAYAFHGPAEKQSVLDGGQTANPWMCCGGSPTQRRRGTSDSLKASIPTYELRGQDPIRSLADEMLETGQGGWCASPANKAVPFAIFDDDGLVETLMHRRAQCWCFGCGCMRCCGEC